MEETPFRRGTYSFVDDWHYPYGFRKYGHFTLGEAELLRVHGQIMAGLTAGKLQPQSTTEARFLQVCQGRREATSDLEKVWLKYLHQSTYARRFFLLGSCCRGARDYADTGNTSAVSEALHRRFGKLYS